MPPQAPAQVKLQQYTAQLTALDAQLRDSPSRPAARGMDPAPGPPGCTGAEMSFAPLRSDPASGLTYAMAAVPVPQGGCQPAAATVQHTSHGNTATLLPTSPASWQQGPAHSLPAATHTASLPACSPTSLELEAEALLQRVRATLLPAGGPLPVPEAGGRGRPGPAHSSCQAVWDEGTLAGAEDSCQMPRVAGAGQEHSSAAHDRVSRLGASLQLKHSRAGPAAAAVPAQPGAGRTAATVWGPRPSGSSRLAQPGPPAASGWATGGEEEGWDTWPKEPVGRGAGQAQGGLLVGLLSAAARPSSTDTMTATARRIIEGAQLQMLQLQFLQRETELCQQQQEHAVRSAQLASVSEHAAGQAGARVADEVLAAAAASAPRSQCRPPPGAAQDGLAGEEPGSGDLAAGRLARLRLLLRRWRRNTVEARQHQCRLLVYMACRRMRCLLKAWCLVALSPAAVPGVVPAGGGAVLEELRLQRQRQHQASGCAWQAMQATEASKKRAAARRKRAVATCFHRLWLQHAVLQHWHLVRQQLSALRQAEQRKALQDGQQLQDHNVTATQAFLLLAYIIAIQHLILAFAVAVDQLEPQSWLQAEQQYWEVASRFRVAYVQHSVLRAWLAAAKAASLVRAADLDAARRKASIAGFLARVAGGATGAPTHETAPLVETDDARANVCQDPGSQQHSKPACCAQQAVQPPVQPPHQERAPFDVRTKDKLTAGLAAGRALMLRRQQQQLLSAQELVPARQQEVLQQPCQQQLAPLPLPAVPRSATAPQAEATSSAGSSSSVFGDTGQAPASLAYNQHGVAVARKPTSAADGGSSCSERCSRTAAGPFAAKGKSEHKPGVWAKPAPTAPRPRVASRPSVRGSGVVTDQMAASLGKGNLAVAAAQGDVTAERLLAQARAAAQRRRRSTQQEVQVAMEALLAEAQLLAELHYQRALLQRCVWFAAMAALMACSASTPANCCLSLGSPLSVSGLDRSEAARLAPPLAGSWAPNRWRGITGNQVQTRDARLHERGHRLRSTLRAWRAEVLRQANVQLAFELELLHVAVGHHARSLTRTGLTAWRLAVRQAADEREAENHKAATWSKINSWLQEHHGRRSHSGEGLKYGGTKDMKLGDITLSELPPRQPPASSMAPASASLALNDSGRCSSSPVPQPTLQQASNTVHTRHTATWASELLSSKGGGGGTQHPEDLHAGCQLEQVTALASSLTDCHLLSLADGPATAIPSLLGPLGPDRLLPPPQPRSGPLQPAWAWPAAGVGGGVEWRSSGRQSIWQQQDPGAQGAPTAPQQASFQAATQGQPMCAPALHQPITAEQCKHQLQGPGTAASDRCPEAGSSNHVQGACGLGSSDGHCRQRQAGHTLAAAAQALRSQRLQRYITQKHSQPQQVHNVEHGT
ncbi:hypothetical protein QJQ45_008420 [Haematococcus lacustris]|nr:hypothetical protein QJQ45_008420 [Haematococcus lacustris]